MISLYTIGFTKKNAEVFFGLLVEHQVEVLVDIRIKPDTQLSGFAKKSDLPFFMKEIVGGRYLHLPELAPSVEILDEYRETKDWGDYVRRFELLLDQREIPRSLDRSLFERNRCALLCSEHTAEFCHRRLVSERLAAAWPGTQVTHLQ